MPPCCKSVQGPLQRKASLFQVPDDCEESRSLQGDFARASAKAPSSAPALCTLCEPVKCWLVESDLDIQLAIGQTNANINSGRVVCCAEPDEVDDIASRGAGGHEVTHDEMRLDNNDGHQARAWRQRTQRDSGHRVGWADPIELIQGPGYSNPALALHAAWWSPTSARACSPTNAKGPGAIEPDNANGLSACKPAAMRRPDAMTTAPRRNSHACGTMVTGRTLARMRADLFGCIGLLDTLQQQRPKPPPRCWENYGKDDWAETEGEGEAEDVVCCRTACHGKASVEDDDGLPEPVGACPSLSSVLSDSSTVAASPSSPASCSFSTPSPCCSPIEQEGGQILWRGGHGNYHVVDRFRRN